MLKGREQVMTKKSKALRKAERQILQLQEALAWCSGSPSFATDGEARKGWLKLCLPLLEDY